MIKNQKIAYSDFGLSSSKNKSPHLSKIKIVGKFKYEDNTIYSFLSQIISLGKSFTMIDLTTFLKSNTASSLLSLLRQINQFQKPEKLKLELNAKFAKQKTCKILGQNFRGSSVNFNKIIKNTQE